MKPLNVFFPRFQIESHREPWQSAELVVELAKLGIRCQLEIGPQTDAVFVGSFFAAEDAANGYHKEPHHRRIDGCKDHPRVPVFHYCWDLYPRVVDDANYPEADRWRHYLSVLKAAQEIWVPTTPVQRRVAQRLDRASIILKPPVPFWEPEKPPQDGDYVLDVMRPYPGDPGSGMAKRACQELGIPFRETGASLSYEDYKKAVANARLLVSTCHEASTGSLALLEGLRLGKMLLVTDSEWNGALELLEGPRRGLAATFKDGDKADLGLKIVDLHSWCGNKLDPLALSSFQKWCDDNYSNAVFAKRMAARLREALGC